MNPNTQEAFENFKGMIHGVFLDGRVTREEILQLKGWCNHYEHLSSEKPFSDFFSEIKSILQDGVVTAEEILDMKVILSKYRKYFINPDAKNADLHFLQGICYGIIADGEVNKHEVYMLKNWLEENEHLSNEEPYKKFHKIILRVLEDGKVDNEESKELQELFTKFLKSEDI